MHPIPSAEQPAPSHTLLLDMALATQLLRYLSERPYRESFQLIHALQQLRPSAEPAGGFSPEDYQTPA